jgi:hypothetical protein
MPSLTSVPKRRLWAKINAGLNRAGESFLFASGLDDVFDIRPVTCR